MYVAALHRPLSTVLFEYMIDYMILTLRGCMIGCMMAFHRLFLYLTISEGGFAAKLEEHFFFPADLLGRLHPLLSNNRREDKGLIRGVRESCKDMGV